MNALQCLQLEAAIPSYAPDLAGMKLRMGIRHVALFRYEVWVIDPRTGDKWSVDTWSHTQAQATFATLLGVADARGWDLSTMTGR